VSAEVKADIAKESEEILSRYGGESGDLIPMLQEAQERFGYLPEEVMQRFARFLKLPESTVFGVSTFYAQFKLTPTGKKLVKVCRGTACHVRGGARILREVEKRLGIKPGETSSDLEYTLETIACFGSCALAPVMVVDKDVYGRMTTAKVGQILGKTK
jgi:NADH-quinone oxidoreductase subunit E